MALTTATITATGFKMLIPAPTSQFTNVPTTKIQPDAQFARKAMDIRTETANGRPPISAITMRPGGQCVGYLVVEERIVLVITLSLL